MMGSRPNGKRRTSSPKDLVHMLDAELHKQVRFREGGRVRKASYLQIVFEQLARHAARRNKRAIAELISLQKRRLVEVQPTVFVVESEPAGQAVRDKAEQGSNE
jgi:hypothetical protein